MQTIRWYAKFLRVAMAWLKDTAHWLAAFIVFLLWLGAVVLLAAAAAVAGLATSLAFVTAPIAIIALGAALLGEIELSRTMSGALLLISVMCLVMNQRYRLTKFFWRCTKELCVSYKGDGQAPFLTVVGDRVWQLADELDARRA